MPKPIKRQGLRVVRREGYTSLYIRGTVAGVSVFESTGTDDAGLAEEARAALEARLYRRAIYGEREKITFAVAVQSYLQEEDRSPATKAAVRKLLLHFGPKMTLDEIGQEVLDGAAKAICHPGVKQTTVLRQITAPAKAILNHAAIRGWVTVPKFKSVKGGVKRTDWATPAEAELQIAAAANHMKPILVFLYCTGARLNEALTLEWKDVDLRYARAVFRGEREGGARGTKSSYDRNVDLVPRIATELANLPGERTGRVFLRHDGSPYRATNDSKTVAYGGQISGAFASSLSRAGIDRHLTPHHCRHSWATWSYLLHRDPMKLRDDGGWRSVALVERYTKNAPASMKAEVEAFFGLNCANSVPLETRGRA